MHTSLYPTLLAISTELLFATEQPKNIILMIGDGMGARHVQAIQYYLTGKDSSALSSFPFQGWMTTYSAYGGYSADSAAADETYVKLKPTDSAASATALSTGVKTYDAAISVGVDSIPLYTVCEAASDAGKATGVVTSVPFSHATPAGMVAHNASRNSYSQIAQEMLLRSRLNVIMGGGHPAYDNNGQKLAISNWNYDYAGGYDLWNNLQKGKVTNLDGAPWTLVQTKGAFDSLAQGLRAAPAHLIGVAPVYETLQARRTSTLSTPALETAVGTTPYLANQPALSNMAKAALRVLSSDSDGFFLMLEGGAIDWASHSNQTVRLLEEGREFFATMDTVIAWIGRNGGFEKNLLIVTADHETGYLSAPGSLRSSVVNKGKGQLPDLQWNSYNHTNQPVRIFAKGLGSELLMTHTDNALVGQFLHSILDRPWKVVRNP